MTARPGRDAGQGKTARALRSLRRLAAGPLFAAAVGAAFVLGYVGYHLYFRGAGIPKSGSDVAFQTLLLYVLGGGAEPTADAPWQLEVARLLAPATTATALGVAVAVALRGEIAEFRLRRSRRHVVVCGLGSQGAALASALAAEGQRVVGIDLDGHAPDVVACRRHGVLVVEGDARDTDVLRRARVGRAAYVVATAGSDDANAEVALRAGELSIGREGPPLTCLAHIRDPGLCVLLRSEELAAARVGFRLDFFSVYEHAARALLDEYPVPPGDRPHVLLVGVAGLGESLLVELSRRNGRAGGVICTVVDAGPHPLPVGERGSRLLQGLDVRFMAEDPLGADWASVAATVRPPIGIVYVSLADDRVGLEVALRARRGLGLDVAVVVVLTHSAGLAGLLRGPAEGEGRYGRLYGFDPGLSMGAGVLRLGTYEVLARAIHDTYLAGRRAAGVTPAENPSAVPWEQLPETLKESNRDQAAHIGVKLAAIGCGIAPLSAGADFTFGGQDVERLARMEHDRWMRQRLRDGWRPGPKDVAARTSPDLVAWEQLTEAARDLDRDAVRSIPALLAAAGYQVVRRPER